MAVSTAKVCSYMLGVGCLSCERGGQGGERGGGGGHTVGEPPNSAGRMLCDGAAKVHVPVEHAVAVFPVCHAGRPLACLQRRQRHQRLEEAMEGGAALHSQSQAVRCLQMVPWPLSYSLNTLLLLKHPTK